MDSCLAFERVAVVLEALIILNPAVICVHMVNILLPRTDTHVQVYVPALPRLLQKKPEHLLSRTLNIIWVEREPFQRFMLLS